jgi:hypothetical protein
MTRKDIHLEAMLRHLGAAYYGIVTLGGQPAQPIERDQVAEAVDLAWDIDGVVDIIDHAASPLPA